MHSIMWRRLCQNWKIFINKSLFIKVYGSLRRIFQIQYNGVIRSFNVRPRLLTQPKSGTQPNYRTETEGGHPFLLRNLIFYFEVFQNYSNSNSIFYSSMEYLTTKILSPNPHRKHVASLHSKRRLVVLALLVGAQ